MTPDALSALHKRAFRHDRGWQPKEFAALLNTPHVTLMTRPFGFALVRTVADESELLTLAVDPDHQRTGIADALMRDWMTMAQGTQAFLEVAADNEKACALYAKHGFAETGRRKAYYTRQTGPAVDAVLMQAALTPR